MLHGAWLQTVIFKNSCSNEPASCAHGQRFPRTSIVLKLKFSAPQKMIGTSSSSSLIFSSVMLRTVPFTHEPVTVRKSPNALIPQSAKARQCLASRGRNLSLLICTHVAQIERKQINAAWKKKVSAVNYRKWKLNVEGRFVQQWRRKLACSRYWIFIENWIVNVCFVSQTTVPLFVIIYF